MNTPPVSSTINDCARGSYQPICLVSVLVERTVLSCVTVSRTISAFLTARTFSRTLLRVPFASYSTSADESTAPASLESSSAVVNLIVLVPVLHLGLPTPFGGGIKNEPLNLPKRSETNLRSLTTALAPDVPIITSPTWKLPKNCPVAWLALAAKSMFNILVVEAYDEGNTLSSYGLYANVALGVATLNLAPDVWPITVSPITNGVEFVRLSVVGSLISSTILGVI